MNKITSKGMLVLLTMFMTWSVLVAQDCSKDENVTCFMTRGKMAIEMAEKPEDYKSAADEFLKALEYDSKCPDIYYNLAFCYEQTGKLDPGNYQKAIFYLNAYLLLLPDAPDKDELQKKIYRFEFLLERAGPRVNLNDLLGNWKFYSVDGAPEEKYDITIFENRGNFFVKYCTMLWIASHHSSKAKKDNKGFEKVLESTKNTKITYNDKISFSTDLMDRLGGSDDKNVYWYIGITTHSKFDYELKYENGMLEGKQMTTYKYVEKIGNSSNVWEKTSECDNDCGEREIYFIKQ
jgi:tetratricopeptide (TPR) repeat protein